MTAQKESLLKKEMIWLLQEGNAHASFEEAVEGIPSRCYGAEVKGVPYTLWRILQHMRISQRDILNYIKNPEYVELSWPDDYWPQEKSPPSGRAWKQCITQINQDKRSLIEWLEDPSVSLFQPIPHQKGGPILLREILVVADHNSYHIGQLILLRGFLGIWKD